MEKVAIIGTGIAGMSAAARLHPHCQLTIFERNHYVGGHTNTIEVSSPNGAVPVDTGFMVFNEVTYPRLTTLFKNLGVETEGTDMSFAVENIQNGYTWTSLAGREWYRHGNTLRQLRFWRMLAEIVRFNRVAYQSLADDASHRSLGDFLETHRFSPLFVDNYLVPTTAAIWSTPHDSMHAFPAATLFRFLYNHGLLGLRSHHPWRTVVGGSREYRKRLIAPFQRSILTSRPAISIQRDANGVHIADDTHIWQRFDRVVIACHADEALKILANPTAQESTLLKTFRYAKNEAILHRDTSVLAPHQSTWAAWNYRLENSASGQPKASTHYWMNRLQKLSGPEQYIVSLNAPEGLIREEKIDWTTTYHHPTFDSEAVEAQKSLPRLNRGRTFFAGSYFRYGFHEDALMSGQNAADALLSESTQLSDEADALLAV